MNLVTNTFLNKLLFPNALRLFKMNTYGNLKIIF